MGFKPNVNLSSDNRMLSQVAFNQIRVNGHSIGASRNLHMHSIKTQETAKVKELQTIQTTESLTTEPNEDVKELKLLFKIRDAPEAKETDEREELSAIIRTENVKPKVKEERKIFVYGPIPETQKVGIYMIQP